MDKHGEIEIMDNYSKTLAIMWALYIGWMVVR
jgi:hypothetical protein